MRFSEILSSGKKTLSLEFFPPKQKLQLGATLSLIQGLSAFRPDFMTVTYGAGGGTREFTRQIVSYIHNELHFPAVAHLTCIGHTKIEIDEVLSRLCAEGIEHVLALRGDLPNGETDFRVTENCFANAKELTAHIREHYDLSIGVAGYPETHVDAKSPEADILYLRDKVNAGAEIIITQLFFDAELYGDFVSRARAQGISVPIIPGVMPIASVSQLERFTTMCGASIPEKLRESLEPIRDDANAVIQFGISYAVELCTELFQSGAPGIHLYTLNKSVQTGPIIAEVFPDRVP